LFVMNADGTRRRLVTRGAGQFQAADRPTWSPDGQKLVFAVDLGDVHALYTVNADGTGLRPAPPCPRNRPSLVPGWEGHRVLGGRRWNRVDASRRRPAPRPDRRFLRHVPNVVTGREADRIRLHARSDVPQRRVRDPCGRCGRRRRATAHAPTEWAVRP